jgi:SAM-dependent methyltransferase
VTAFGPVAPHYDVLMRSIPYDMWVEYYRLLLARLGSSPRRLLDVCCGTGTAAEILGREGIEVVGVDLSPGMVQAARQKALRNGSKNRYEVADVTDFDLGETFEGAYSFFDSLNYVATLEGFWSALARIRAHLEPGAAFVFDLNTAYAFEERLFDQEDRSKRSPIHYTWRGDYDPRSRVIRVRMEFVRGAERFFEEHVQRAHSHEEVLEGLSEAGFGRVEAFDAHTLDSPHAKSDRVHYLAVVPGSLV